MLVPFPIAFFSGALISDIISHWGDPVFWPRLSLVLIGLGIIGALLAAVFGFVDFLTAPLTESAKKTATTHMVLNLVVVAIFAVAYFVRYGDATSVLGYVLTVLGVLVLFASGYLGGKLVFEDGVGMKGPRAM